MLPDSTPTSGGSPATKETIQEIFLRLRTEAEAKAKKAEEEKTRASIIEDIKTLLTIGTYDDVSKKIDEYIQAGGDFYDEQLTGSKDLIAVESIVPDEVSLPPVNRHCTFFYQRVPGVLPIGTLLRYGDEKNLLKP